MKLLARLFQSSVGKKLIMGISGFALVLFACGHMVGNLQIFLGPEALNRYGQMLHFSPELLWVVRLALLTLVGLHVWAALQVSAENRAARPETYDGNPVPPDASYASRTMLMSGLTLAAFVIFHLLHYTARVKAVNLTGTDFTTLTETVHGIERHDVYSMVVLGFRQPLVSVFYLVAVGLLCLHLSHGIRAMFQSLGWVTHHCRPFLDKAAPFVAIVLFVGYAAVPVAVLLRLVGSTVTP